MLRNAVAVLALFVFCVALCGQDADPVKERLFAAKGAFDAEWKAIRQQTEEWFDKREEAARKAGDKKLVDEIKAERDEFDDGGEAPKAAPTAIRARQERALKTLESAYAQAVKDYTRIKKDEHAAAVEGELQQLSTRLRGIDLLALIDPKAHGVLGEWKRDGRSVVGVNPQFPGVLQLPYEPGEEYDLEASVRRLSGKEYFGFQLVAGGKRLGVSIDTWPTKGYMSGIGNINGKSLLDNGTGVKGQFIHNGADLTVLCSVRSRKLDVSIDGKSVISYKGEFSNFSVHSDFRVPNEKALAVQIGYTSPYKINRLVVMPVRGKGTVTK